VGPFTLAVMLRGYESFLEDMLDEPAFAESLLAFTSQVGQYMLDAFRPVVDAVMFHESWMAPPLCSPGLYKQFAWEPQRTLFRAAREKGYGLAGLISGGQTTALAGDMARTGANMLIADMRSDLRLFSSLCARNGITLRVNLPGTLLLNRDEAAVKASMARIAEAIDGFRDWYVGCGVVPYEAVPEDVLWLRDLLVEDL
jgi:uroporphyrinogen-III decarboxylase